MWRKEKEKGGRGNPRKRTDTRRKNRDREIGEMKTKVRGDDGKNIKENEIKEWEEKKEEEGEEIEKNKSRTRKETKGITGGGESCGRG